MKKRWICALLGALLLLAGCEGKSAAPAEGAAVIIGARGQTVTARVVQAGETVLLAGLRAPHTDVYAVPERELLGAGVSADDLKAGALLLLSFDGGVEETFPARLGEIDAAVLPEDGYDGLCSLYLAVLDDLWEKDPALHAQISRIGFDLGSTRLSDSEAAALAWAFAQAHGEKDVVHGTWQELAEQGILDGENLYWEDGVLLSIREKNAADGEVRFDAEMWRSGLGAYLLNDCDSRRLLGGAWEPYTVGSEAIS